MRHFVTIHFPLVLSGLIFITSVGLLITARLSSPTQKLFPPDMISPKVRRLIQVVFVLLCAVLPFYNTALGVYVLVPLVLMLADSLANMWMLRGLGEQGVLDVRERAARNSSRTGALASTLASAVTVVAAGGVMLFLSPDPATWGYYSALGIILYGALRTIRCRDIIWTFRRLAAGSRRY